MVGSKTADMNRRRCLVLLLPGRRIVSMTEPFDTPSWFEKTDRTASRFRKTALEPRALPAGVSDARP